MKLELIEEMLERIAIALETLVALQRDANQEVEDESEHEYDPVLCTHGDNYGDDNE